MRAPLAYPLIHLVLCAVLYLATPSGDDVRAAMRAGLLACMTTPAQGNVIPPGCLYACDNGKFGKGWPGAEAWFAWLKATLDRYGPDRCLWAVAPDVPMDATATLTESLPWLQQIRSLGIPAAFAAQDGSEHGLIPWDLIDVLFLAGSTEWKTSPAAHRPALEARERGLDATWAASTLAGCCASRRPSAAPAPTAPTSPSAPTPTSPASSPG
ncbi:hypothetical protein [Streptomyces sp.]|uniref:hypothetical protein n=1 Tax=Streptomyces sp. TaxID=1931 RepID=UPI0025E75C0E|nr:hypothetical protein [Streptomyces sp.]